MKKILMIAAILMTFAACSNTQKTEVKELTLIEKTDVYFKDGIAYDIVTDEKITALVMSEGYGERVYSEYLDGIKRSEKVIDDNQELTYKIDFDQYGLIDGEISLYDSYYNEQITSNYSHGIKDGLSVSTYEGDVVSEITYDYGVINGSYKYTDYNSLDLVEEQYKDGFLVGTKAIIELDNKLNSDTRVPLNMLVEKDEVYTYQGNPYTGLGFNAYDGYVQEAKYFLDGKLTHFYYLSEDGTLLESEEFFEDGSSLYIAYNSYDSWAGSVYYYNYISGDEYNGPYAMFYEDGTTFVGGYKDGLLHGEGIYYNPDGSINEVQDYDNNSYTTTSYFDYDAGLINVTGSGYSKDNMWYKDGKWTYYFEDGTINETIDFDGDYGWSIIYDENGNKLVEGQVDSLYELYEGEITEYYPSGKVSVISTYSEGYLNGETTYFDEEGNVTKVEVYEYDSLIKEKYMDE